AHEVINAKAGEFRAQCAGVEPRDIEQSTKDFFNRLKRGVDVVSQASVLTSAAFNQAGDIEPRGIQWLKDVVTCRREELGLGDIRRLALPLGVSKRGIETGQLLGSLAHTPFQSLIRPLEGLCRLDARRNVGKRRCYAAVGHLV